MSQKISIPINSVRQRLLAVLAPGSESERPQQKVARMYMIFFVNMCYIEALYLN